MQITSQHLVILQFFYVKPLLHKKRRSVLVSKVSILDFHRSYSLKI
jgi:hypothetical protein